MRSRLLFIFCWLVSQNAFAGQTFEYDALHHLISVNKADGKRILYDYDTQNRLKKITDPDGGTVAFTHNSQKNCLSMLDHFGTSTFWFDKFGRVEEVNYPQGEALIYRYDLCNRIKNLWPPFGSKVHYKYDLADRLIEVDSQWGKIKYSYDQKANLLNQVILPNGVNTTYRYDSQKRITDVLHQRFDHTLIAAIHYDYDSAGKCIRREEENETGKRIIEYAYDKLNRLLQVSTPDGFEKFTYDPLGNRLSLETENEKTLYTYNQNNQLTQAGETHFFYDLNGNLIKKVTNAQEVHYSYDYEDRLIEYRDDRHHITYAYDGMGRRISKTIDGKQHFFFNSMHSPVTEVLDETDENKRNTAHYIYGLGRIMGIIEGCPVFYLNDGLLGNVIVIVDTDQKIQNAYNYSAFGIPKKKKEKTAHSYLFCGENYEEETGLIFLRNRYYDPQLGRFITPDPKMGNLLNPQSLNPYTYVNNNPVNAIDPLGLDEEFVAGGYPGGTLTNRGISMAGHVFGMLIDDDAKEFFGLYPNKLNKTDERYSGAITHKWTVTDEQAHQIRNMFVSETWSVTNNCVDAVCKALDLIGVEHPSFKALGIVSLPTNFMRWVESVSGKSNYRDVIQQNINFIYDPDLFVPVPWPSNEVKEPSSILPKPDLGGVSLNKTAKLLGEISDLVGATYDKEKGQLILIGRQNRSLPSMNFDDLAVAVRSVYGLGNKPPEDPGVTIDWNPENNKLIKKGKTLRPLPVRFYGMTENTRFGQIMFEADRLLKCLTFGEDNITKQPLHVHLNDYQSLYDRKNKKKKLKSFEMHKTMERLWFMPKEITLIEGSDKTSMQFSEVSMEVRTEVTQKGKVIKDSISQQFADYITHHYDTLSQQFPVFQELKQLGQITGVIKWIKEHQIPLDLTLFDAYSPQYHPTAPSTPIITKFSVKDGMTLFSYTGGVLMQLSNENFHRIPREELNDFHDAVLQARPSEYEWSWSVDSPMNAEQLIAIAQTIQRVPRIGNVKKIFVDMSYPLLGSELFGVTRIYNSFNDFDEGLGRGWEILPAKLRFHQSRQWHWLEEKDKAIFCYGAIHLRKKGQEEVYELKEMNAEDNPVYCSKSGNSVLSERADGSFVLHQEEKQRYLFSEKGQLLEAWNSRGNITKYHFIDNQICTMTHQSGARIDFEWKNGRLVRINGPGGKTISYACDEKQHLTNVSDTKGLMASYIYDDESHLIGIFDCDHRVIFEAVYDDYHRALSERNHQQTKTRHFEGRTLFEEEEGGLEVKNEYSPSCYLLNSTDSFDRKLSVEYEKNGFRPVAIKNSLGQYRKFQYDNHGKITCIESPEKEKMRFWYNQKGNLKVFQTENRMEIYDYNEDGMITKIHHDGQVNLRDSSPTSLSYHYDHQNFTEYKYDPNSKHLTSIMRNGEVSKQFLYNPNGLLSDIIDPYGYTCRREYDESFRLSHITDGQVTKKFTYDIRDQITKIQYKNASKEYSYDGLGRLTEIKEANSAITRLEYDENAKLAKIIDPEGGVTQYDYNKKGALIRIFMPNRTKKELRYDLLQRVVGND